MSTAREEEVSRSNVPRRLAISQQVNIEGTLELIREIVAALAEITSETGEIDGEAELLSCVMRLGRIESTAPMGGMWGQFATENLFQRLNKLNKFAAKLQKSPAKTFATRELRLAGLRAVEVLNSDELREHWGHEEPRHEWPLRTTHLTIGSSEFFSRIKQGFRVKALRSEDDVTPELLAMSLKEAVKAYSNIAVKSTRFGRRKKGNLRRMAQVGFWRVTVGVGAVVVAKFSGRVSNAEGKVALRVVSRGEHDLARAQNAVKIVKNRGIAKQDPP